MASKLESGIEVGPSPVNVRGALQAAAKQYRILCVGETWLGSDARAAFEALRRLGHSIEILDANHYLPLQWQTLPGRAIRKVFRPVFVRELRLDAARIVARYKPHCLFVWKGTVVHPKLIEHCKQQGVVTINYYPDVSFFSHGSYIPRSLPLYDHVFNTKSYGVGDMKKSGVGSVSFLEPGYDPELHRPVELTAEDRETYGCDVGFIGTWSPKKESLLSTLRKNLPQIKIKIWGNRWDQHRDEKLNSSILGYGVTGDEYTKAICGSSICLGLLSEQGQGSSSGDLITARTFQIPACGAFMLHERNTEVLNYFEDGRDAEFFGTSEELAEKVEYYLAHDEKRRQIAGNGFLRSLRDGYSIDRRMESVLGWLNCHLSQSPARQG
jgi:spore maturation protein CgeB